MSYTCTDFAVDTVHFPDTQTPIISYTGGQSVSHVLLWQPSECAYLIVMILFCYFRKINMMMMMIAQAVFHLERRRTHTQTYEQTDKVTDPTDHNTNASATAGVGNIRCCSDIHIHTYIHTYIYIEYFYRMGQTNVAI